MLCDGPHSRRGVFGQEGTQPTMLSIAFTQEGMVLTGSQSGDLYLWKGARLEWQFEQVGRAKAPPRH